MDIKEYRYILEVVKHGSISEAAKELFISQPSLSMYIKNLEKRIGSKFFHKVDGKFHLTDTGKIYIEYAKKIVLLDNELIMELRKIKDLQRGEVTIGITKTRGTLLLHKLLPNFIEKYPDIKVKVIEDTSERLEELLNNREADFVILNYPFKNHEFDYSVLRDEEVVVTIPKTNDICKKAKDIPGLTYKWIDINELKDQPFILLKQGQRMRQIADFLFSEASLKPYVLWETSSAVTAYNLSASGIGLSFITDNYCMTMAHSNINYFSIGKPQIVFKMAAAYPSSSLLSEASKALIQIVKENI
jgi:DNA-binding transcriptional LysR family regulator